MANESAPPVGIAWYRAQDYGQIRRIMADAAEFPVTYREWREVSERLGISQARVAQLHRDLLNRGKAYFGLSEMRLAA